MIIDEEACPAIYPALTPEAVREAITDDFNLPCRWSYVDRGAGSVGAYTDVRMELEYTGPGVWEVSSTYDSNGNDLPAVGDWQRWPALRINGRDGWTYEVEPVLMRCGLHLLNCYRLAAIAERTPEASA